MQKVIKRKTARLQLIKLTEVVGIIGSLWMIILSPVEMNTNGLVKTVHSALHLMISVVTFLLFIGLLGVGIQLNKILNRLGSLAVIVTLFGMVLYGLSNFIYAIFHGLLDLLPPQNNPIVDVTGFLGFCFIAVGSTLLGTVFINQQILSDKLCLFLILGNLIFSLGNILFSPTVYQLSNLWGYLVAFIIVGPYCIAWICVIYEIYSQRERKDFHEMV